MRIQAAVSTTTAIRSKTNKTRRVWLLALPRALFVPQPSIAQVSNQLVKFVRAVKPFEGISGH
jgi:hypothetical protein